jgi:hypothetical protein
VHTQVGAVVPHAPLSAGLPRLRCFRPELRGERHLSRGPVHAREAVQHEQVMEKINNFIKINNLLIIYF